MPPFTPSADSVPLAGATGTAPAAHTTVVEVATKATLDLAGGAGDTLRVQAIEVGSAGNELKAGVDPGDLAGFQLFDTDALDNELERSPDLADTAAAITWAATSAYIRASELPGAGDPVTAGAAALTGGASALRAGVYDLALVTFQEGTPDAHHLNLELRVAGVTVTALPTFATPVALHIPRLTLAATDEVLVRTGADAGGAGAIYAALLVATKTA